MQIVMNVLDTTRSPATQGRRHDGRAHSASTLLDRVSLLVMAEGRWHRLVGEATRFLAVGGVATLVALFLFNLLLHGFWVIKEPPLGDHPLWAYIVANAVGMVISYRGTRSWAFRHRRTAHPDGGRTAFVVINLVTMSIPVGFLWVSRNVLHQTDPFSDNLAANVLGLGAGTAARFYLFRTWVFRHPELAGGPLDLTATRDGSTSDPTPPAAPGPAGDSPRRRCEDRLRGR